MNGIRMPYIDIGSIDVVRVRNSLLRLQHHSIEVIWDTRRLSKDFWCLKEIPRNTHKEWFWDSGSSQCWTSWRRASESGCCSPSPHCWTPPGACKSFQSCFGRFFSESGLEVDSSHAPVKFDLAEACSSSSSSSLLSREWLKNESVVRVVWSIVQPKKLCALMVFLKMVLFVGIYMLSLLILTLILLILLMARWCWCLLILLKLLCTIIVDFGQFQPFLAGFDLFDSIAVIFGQIWLFWPIAVNFVHFGQF